MGKHALKDRDLQTLAELRSTGDRLRKISSHPFKAEGWVRPKDIGGHGNSHHWQSLAKLVDRDLAERRYRNDERDQFFYRITSAGIALLDEASRRVA